MKRTNARFFGPCVTSLPFLSTPPMSGSSSSAAASAPLLPSPANSRSSMRRRSSFIAPSTRGSRPLAVPPHGSMSFERALRDGYGAGAYGSCGA
jgi:hypothetical protein